MFFQAVGALLTIGWTALTTMVYPGTSISIAAILIGAFCAAASLKIIGYVIGVSYNTGGMIREAQGLSKKFEHNAMMNSMPKRK